MKTLREKAQALFDLSQDWFLGKEKILHQGAAAQHLATAEALATLERRVEALEKRAATNALASL